METIKKVKVRNMEGSRIGKPVANQFIIETDEGRYFQSYDSIIAFMPWSESRGKVIIDRDYWDYSTTTGKYRNKFLGVSGKDEVLRRIKEGVYEFGSLN